MDRLLLVDDDTELCELVAEYLGPEGFEIEAVHDGRSGVERAAAGRFALIILDVMLPELGGFDVLRRLREHSDVPVLMLTARGDEIDRIVGLELGADDYLAKPFNPRELSARIRAILRRARGGDETSPALLSAGDLELDTGGRSARVSGREIELTGIEFELLATLLGSAGSVISRDELSREALGRRASAFDRSLDVHISNLRRKLGPMADGKERIKTVRGVGYLYLRPAHSSQGGSDA